MSAEFVDTNILVYAHDKTSPAKQRISVDLLERLATGGTGRFSTQVLLEFFSAVTRKLGLPATIAIEILDDLAKWTVYRPSAEDIADAARLTTNHSLSIWDALIVQSAIRSGCDVLWSEDLQDGYRFGTLVVRNPFLAQVAPARRE